VLPHILSSGHVTWQDEMTVCGELKCIRRKQSRPVSWHYPGIHPKWRKKTTKNVQVVICIVISCSDAVEDLLWGHMAYSLWIRSLSSPTNFRAYLISNSYTSFLWYPPVTLKRVAFHPCLLLVQMRFCTLLYSIFQLHFLLAPVALCTTLYSW
jgi:hypothetical protein